MNRLINQLNVSITTNRTCTLRCDHCYIAPHLFDDKSQMSTETFRLIFDQVERLYDVDNRLEEIEWEAIGGETTMMPFSWWEENLPYALERIQQINKKIGKNGALNFLTNLVYTDKRYTDLINEYANHPAFCLYTSWEPDTNRFGKNNKLFPRFLKTLESIKAEQKILDVILTKTVVDMGPEYLIETFVSRGITDFSVKMLSPYGSGKQFFKENMVDFDSMSKYLIKLGQIKPQHVTYTPQDEMMSSLFRGTSFQCNGNFQYDLAIETDGSCSFNANQTADEASLGSRVIHIRDPLWAEKVMYENKKEENNKLSLSHPVCNQCEYMRYCNAGWYHYKIHDASEIRKFDQEDCSGYKKMWAVERERLKGSLHDLSLELHLSTKQRFVDGRLLAQDGGTLIGKVTKESDLEKRYSDYFSQIAEIEKDIVIELDLKKKFHKSCAERLWFYESLGVKSVLSDVALIDESVVTHWLYRNYKKVYIKGETIMSWMAQNPSARITRHFTEAVAIINGVSPDDSFDLVPDNRNEELFRTLLATNSLGAGVNTSSSNVPYINRLKLFNKIEKMHVKSSG